MNLDVLAQKIEAHQLWLESRRLDGAQAVFKGQDLRFANLAGKRLNECVLTESNLERSDLRGIFLGGADLRKVNLAYANLSGADLSGANLSGARLEGAILDSADFRDALIEDAIFDSASLKNANFTAARGSRAKFNRADMSSSELDAAVFQDAQFSGANLTQASLRETNLDRATMRGTALSGAHVDGASLRETILLEAILVGVSFEHSNIEGARLDRNALGGALPDEDETTTDGKKGNPAEATASGFSGAALTQDQRMADLLRRRDELQQSLRTRLLQIKGNAAEIAEDPEIQELRSEFDRVDAERRVLRQETRRQEDYRRHAQGDLQSRVDAAIAALNRSMISTNRQLRFLSIWQATLKITGMSLIAISSVTHLAYMIRQLVDAIDNSFFVSVVDTSALFVGGLALLLLDFVTGLRTRPLVERRNRIENVIAALGASMQLSMDSATNQTNLLETFEAARKLLLETRNKVSDRERS